MVVVLIFYFKYDNNKSDNAKENTEIDQNNNLQVPNEVGDLKLSDNINSTKVYFLIHFFIIQ